MFCSKCGKENDNSSKFCIACGNPLESVSMPINNPFVKENTMVVKNTNKKTKGLMTIGAVVGVCVFVGGGALALSSLNSGINLNKYVNVEVEGFEGYGTVKAEIDWDSIEKKYGKKISFKGSAKKEYGLFLEDSSPIEMLSDFVNIEIDKNTGLSNGDVVHYTINIDGDMDKYINCKMKSKSDDYKVSGLKEVDTFDAFSNLTVEFSGIAPNGRANMNYTGNEIQYNDFILDKSDGLSNDETVKVTINQEKMSDYAEKLGKIPETMEREFCVEGLDSYLTSSAELSADNLEQIKRQAQDAFSSYVAKNWGEGEKLVSFTYIGNYILVPKNADNTSQHNVVDLIYKAQINNSYSNKKDSYNKVNEVYWYASFNDVLLDSNGNVKSDLTKYRTPDRRITIDSGVDAGWWSTKTWYYYGYSTIDEVYKDLVLQNIDRFNHEDNIDESVETATLEASDSLGINDGDYMIKDSDSRIISKDDLEGFTAKECKIARNEIYARHGRKFQDEELQEYFNSRAWYNGTIEANNFSETMLNDIEIANKDIIVEFEKEKGYR